MDSKYTIALAISLIILVIWSYYAIQNQMIIISLIIPYISEKIKSNYPRVYFNPYVTYIRF